MYLVGSHGSGCIGGRVIAVLNVRGQGIMVMSDLSGSGIGTTTRGCAEKLEIRNRLRAGNETDKGGRPIRLRATTNEGCTF